MPRSPKFQIVYAPQVKAHLRPIAAKHHSLIRKAIERQLHFQPDRETRNRKPMQRPVEFGAEWELRCGPRNQFRVFYAVDRTETQVHILAIGVKDRDRLSIGGQEIEL